MMTTIRKPEKEGKKTMALQRKWIASPNYSGRGTSGVRLIVIHTAEGALTIESLGNFFANSSSGVSSHTGIDDKPGIIGEYVKRSNKAWTAGNANPYSVQTELCAFAKWPLSEWNKHPVMLQNCADWVREEATGYGIPIVRLNAAQAQGGGYGVCQHADLGASGGGHWDCGGGFPMDEVLRIALGDSPSGPQQPQRKKGHTMIASTPGGKGYWTATYDGAVNCFGDAQFRGSSFDVDPLTPGAQKVDVTGEIVGIAGCNNNGYWLLASDGGIFTFGDAQFYGRPDRV
jgi:hypothetical protein